MFISLNHSRLDKCFLCNFCTEGLVCGQLSGHIHLADQSPVLRASLPTYSCGLNTSGQPFRVHFIQITFPSQLSVRWREPWGTPQLLPHVLVSSSVPSLISHPESQGLSWKSSESLCFGQASSCAIGSWQLLSALILLGCNCSGKEALIRMLPTYPGEAGTGTRAGQPLLGPRANFIYTHLESAHLLPHPTSSLRGGGTLGGWPHPLCQPEPRAGLEDTPLAVALRVAADAWACPAEYSCFAIYQFLFEKSTELCSCVKGLSGGSFSPVFLPCCPARGPRLWCPVLTSREAGVPRGPWPGRVHDAVFHGSRLRSPVPPLLPPQGPGTPYLGPSPFNTRPSPRRPPPGSLGDEG